MAGGFPCDNGVLAVKAVNRMEYAAVAQWIEYWPPKPRVVGSIPASRTTFFEAMIVFSGGSYEMLEIRVCRNNLKKNAFLQKPRVNLS